MTTVTEGHLYVKSLGSLIRNVPLQKEEAQKWGIGNGLNDYRLLSDYLAQLTPDDVELIVRKAHISGVHLESEMPKIGNIYLPIIERGGYPPDEELSPLMQQFDIPNKRSLEMGLYWFLFTTTNYGTELRTIQ